MESLVACWAGEPEMACAFGQAVMEHRDLAGPAALRLFSGGRFALAGLSMGPRLLH